MVNEVVYMFTQQAQQLMSICREYIVGLSMEIPRKELPKVRIVCRHVIYSYIVSVRTLLLIYTYVHVVKLNRSHMCIVYMLL